MSTLRDTYIETLLSWKGTPFHHQGRVPGHGLDCVGLPLCGAWAVGIPMKDNLEYGHEPSSKFLRNMITEVNQLVPCAVDDHQPGDLLLMRYSAEPTHVAVETHDGIVHAYAPMRMVVHMPWADSLKNLVVGRYRYKWPS